MHDRYSDEQNAEDIDQQECRTSVFACDIGKSPDIAQTDGTAGCNEYGAQLAAERCPMSCFHHLVLFCLTENRNRFSAVFLPFCRPLPAAFPVFRAVLVPLSCLSYSALLCVFVLLPPVFRAVFCRAGCHFLRSKFACPTIFPALRLHGRPCLPAAGRVWLPYSVCAGSGDTDRITPR